MDRPLGYGSTDNDRIAVAEDGSIMQGYGVAARRPPSRCPTMT
ncbi:hypothetical protein [Curtanaerobium respiraculi]|nr:hypothetical protein [Curtanaerobium respiraculi]